jgi:C1A family cysteine protease
MSENICRVLNHKFQKHDSRDFIHNSSVSHEHDTIALAAATVTSTAGPFTVKNYNKIVILDQGEVGSCVSNAFALCISIMTGYLLNASRLFLYFNGRGLAGNYLENDTGLTVRAGCKSIIKYGLCEEMVYPYKVDIFANLPPLKAYQQSSLLNSFKYSFITQNLTSIKNCLKNTNSPIVFSIQVYSSFMSDVVASNGIVPMPDVVNETLEGGHCVCMLGYDDVNKWLICANSWGTEWGNKGLFYLPYNYVVVDSLASDFCSVSFKYGSSAVNHSQSSNVNEKSGISLDINKVETLSITPINPIPVKTIPVKKINPLHKFYLGHYL